MLCVDSNAETCVGQHSHSALDLGHSELNAIILQFEVCNGLICNQRIELLLCAVDAHLNVVDASGDVVLDVPELVLGCWIEHGVCWNHLWFSYADVGAKNLFQLASD